MVLSDPIEPDTIVVPSGENATEEIIPLCALAFSIFNCSVAVQECRETDSEKKAEE